MAKAGQGQTGLLYFGATKTKGVFWCEHTVLHPSKDRTAKKIAQLST